MHDLGHCKEVGWLAGWWQNMPDSYDIVE